MHFEYQDGERYGVKEIKQMFWDGRAANPDFEDLEIVVDNVDDSSDEIRIAQSVREQIDLDL